MEVASLELSKTLWKLSGWDYLSHQWLSPYDDSHPVYDLGYLLRKLPQNSWVGYVDTSGRRDFALAKTYAWNEKGDDINKIAECRADTPEDAACLLAIELFKHGVLKRE